VDRVGFEPTTSASMLYLVACALDERNLFKSYRAHFFVSGKLSKLCQIAIGATLSLNITLESKKDSRQYAPTNNSPLTEDQGEVEGGAADEQNSIY
jgi:hypothetical protein